MALRSSIRHCEERSDEAIHLSACCGMDCFASLAMTVFSKPKSQLLRGRTKSLHQPRALQQARRGAVVAEHDEGQRLAARDVQAREIGDAQRSEAACGEDA